MPHELPLLQDLLVLLVASVPIAFISTRLRLPVIVGFMVSGVVIGPYSLKLIRDDAAVEALAEIGVVLLLFAIGLEFSLRKILEMRRLVFAGGGLQVGLTGLIISVVAYELGRPFGQAVFFGFLIALSSTAIVLKSFADRAEVDTPHGRGGTGILLFQDLCVVPMMLLAPILSGREGGSPGGVLLTLGTAVGAVVLIIVAARTLVPRALYHIVRLRSPEVFIIFVVLVSLGTSWVTSQFGLSLALGAFIAGLVLSESEYSHQIVADILPFRDVFNSIFFVSIGMLLSLSFLVENLLQVLAWVVVLIIGKALITLGVIRLLGYSLRISAMVGVSLAQVGEFSFILAKVGLSERLISQNDYQTFLAASILSMIATPFLIMVAPRIGYFLQAKISRRGASEARLGSTVPRRDLKGHVVIVGYGLNGRNLAAVLKHVNIPYLVLELNPEAVREALGRGEPMVYGDSTRRELLKHLNIEEARVLVLAISDPIATRRTVFMARALSPNLHIVVRTRYMSELDDLYKLGADQVIPEEFETSIEIFSRVLKEYSVPRNVIQREVERIRNEGYQMLRQPSVPLLEMNAIADALGTTATHTIFVEPSFPTVGKSLAELDLRRKTGATVITAIRDGSTEINPGPEFKLEAEDILVLMGAPEQIDSAEANIRGRS